MHLVLARPHFRRPRRQHEILHVHGVRDVVWRDAQTGDELARAQDLPAITLGTMVQPYYFGKIFYPGYEQGDLLELTVRKR